MNLYVHFPFCRRKCTYCALYSRVGADKIERDQYVLGIARKIAELEGCFKTVYFGGGSPALCDLRPIFEALKSRFADEYEFTVELHPLDVSERLLDELKQGGVNRISMGVQSLDDRVLEAMGRGYTINQAERAFGIVRCRFTNVGIDLIVGYPRDRLEDAEDIRCLADWGLSHCSVYSLQNERGLQGVPDDDMVLDRLQKIAGVLKTMGLERYEISNYARAGFECRHNLAVWNGEDYIGLGDGACGRQGLKRTRNWGGKNPQEELVTEEFDRNERLLFRLRTKYGIGREMLPEKTELFERLVREGTLQVKDDNYCLTARGAEICDAILAELI